MDYTSMGSRGKYASENNLWSHPWSASQPSSRRGSEQSVKDVSNVPRTGVVSENNTDFKIGSSIETLRRDGELSMGAPPPLTAAFSGSVSNFTHQSSSNVNQARRRGSRRSVAEVPPGPSQNRTVDINGDEGQSASAARSAGNLSQAMLGGSLGSRSLHKQKSGEVHRSVPPGLSSINDVSNSAEELDSSGNGGQKGSSIKINQDSGNASSLPSKFTLKQSTNDVYQSTPPGLSSQQDMTASIDDMPANLISNLQLSQQGGGSAKSPFASRSNLKKATETARSRNELKPPPGLSSVQNVSASTNGAPSASSLQTPQQNEKKAKSPYASRASFKASTNVLASEVSNQPPREESELQPPPGLSSAQGSSAKADENLNKNASASQSFQHGNGKVKSARASRASGNKGSTHQVNGNEPCADVEELTATQSFADDSSPYVGYVPSSAQPSRKDRDVRGEETAPVNLGASKLVNLGLKDAERSGPSKSAFDLRSADKNGKGASSTLLSKNERRVRIEDTPGQGGSATLSPKKEVTRASASGTLANKAAVELGENDSNAATTSYSRLSDRGREARVEQTDVKTFAPEEVQTSFASLAPLPRKFNADLKTKETSEKASGASYNQLAEISRVEGISAPKTFSPKEVQTSVLASPPRKPSVDLKTKEIHEKASGISHNQLAGNSREPRTEEATRFSKLQSPGDLKHEPPAKPEPAKANAQVAALPYSAAPSSFVTSVLSSIKAKNKAAELSQKDAAKPTEPLAFDKAGALDDRQPTAASNATLASRIAASGLATRTPAPRHSENEINRFSSNASATTLAAKLNERSGDNDIAKNSRANSTTASESSLYSGPSLNASQRSLASSVVDRRTERDDVESHRFGKTVSIGGISSVGNSGSNLVGSSRGSIRVDGSEYLLSASERASTNSVRKRYGADGSAEVLKTATKEDAAKTVEPTLERLYAFALKWDPYTLRVKCEHKGEIRLAYLPIRKILDEQDDSSMIVNTFQKLFSDSIHNPDIFDQSRHFLAFLDADGDWCTLGDTPEDYKVFVESSKFDPTKAASRVARLKSFDLSILKDLSRRKSTDSAEEEEESPSVPISRRQSQGSVKSATSVGERSGGRKLMHGDSDDLQKVLRKDSFGSSILSVFTSTAFSFPNEAFSLQQAVFLGWLVGAAPMAVAVRHSDFWMTSGLQTEDYHREEPWYEYTIFTLGMSMILSLIGYARAGTVDKQRLGLALLCVNLISFCSYLGIVAGLTPAVSDIVNRPLEIVRYMDWAFTCPTLILLMGQLTQTEGNVRRAMIVNVVMIVSRFFGSCLPWSYALPFSAASFGCFSFLIRDTWRWWSAAVTRAKAAVMDRGETKGSIGVKSLIFLQISSTTSLVMYPIIWLLGISDVVSFEESEVLYCVADVLAKVMFTMIAVSNCFKYSGSSMSNSDFDTTLAKKPSGKSNTSTSSQNSIGRMLQREPSVDMDTFDAATVFSCEIIGYTAMVDRFTDTNGAKTLHNLWKHFDSIARVHHIYKVDSKASAFMGVAGAPDRSNNHAEQAAEFALDVLQMVKVFTTEQNKKGQREKLRLRIGLHTGPLSAGVVDRKNLRYGVFGDTVTTAGRLEKSCLPMRIQVSEATYKALEGEGFEFERSEGPKAKERTYFLVGKRMEGL